MISTTRDARPRRLTRTLLWSAQILLAAFFVFVAAGPKLKGSHASVQEFGLIGAGQWLRYLVGTAELAGGIGLLTPWLAGLAAVGLAADMAGATVVNATVLRNTTYGVNVWMTALLCAVFVLLAYSRRQQIRGLAAAVRRVTLRRSRRFAAGVHAAARRVELVPAQLAPGGCDGRAPTHPIGARRRARAWKPAAVDDGKLWNNADGSALGRPESPQRRTPVSIKRRATMGAAAAALGAAGVLAGFTAGGQHASAAPQRQFTLDGRLTAIQFFTATGPIIGFPTVPLVAGDRIIGQDRITQDGQPAGHDNEACTVSFNRDVLCQDIVILTGQGDLQAGWTLQWPATGPKGPPTFDGVIDGGTGRFGSAHGSFHAATLRDGKVRLTIALSENDR